VRKFMKLFKSLLVAPATLGLLAPMSATANELNITDVSAYSSSEEIENISEFNAKDLAVTNSRVDGLEARFNNFEAGSFSETTTASFGANFYIGSVSDDDNVAAGANDLDDAVSAGYDFQISLNTSFTGEDSFDVTIDSGNFGANGVAEFGGDDTNDGLNVDGIAYTFPLGDKTTVMVGDNMDGSSLFTTACVYGGPSDTLDDCGVPNANFANGGTMAGASYDFGNGLTAAIGYAGGETSLMTEEGEDDWGLNIAYTGDKYGVSASYAKVDVTPANLAGSTTAFVDTGTEDSFIAIQAYYTPEGSLPSISVGYEVGEDGSVVGNSDQLESYFLGLTWDEIGPGSGGVAVGTKAPQVEDSDRELMYEAYYDYPVNDGVTITPLFFVKEHSAAGTDDETGLMIKTSFSF